MIRALLLVAVAAVAVRPAATHVARDHNQPEGAARSDLPQPDAAEFTAQYWIDEADRGLRQRAGEAGRGGAARNVVMFLGDGMSVPTLAAARALLGQRRGRPGEEAQLSFETFPSVGLSKTYCLNGQIADSACTATAYLCGVKANRGTIGLSGAVQRHDCDASTDTSAHLDSIAAWALQDGRDAGVVTTTRITHASPAGAYARVANRHYESDADVGAEGFDTDRCPDIAHQLINMAPGKNFKVILGGGRQEFRPTTTLDEEGSPGTRTDGRDLIEEWKNQKAEAGSSYNYVWNREQLMEVFDNPPEYLLGLFESSHLEYHMLANETKQPTLAELTEVAIRSLSRNEKGFFLFIEGGRIDHGHHDNYVQLALDETIELSKAVERAAELLPADDSLLVVTADHAHVMAFNGYRHRGEDILGPSDDRDLNGVPYMTLSYTNGPGARTQLDGVLPDVTQENYHEPLWRAHADVPLDSETHGGDDVAVFARGPHHRVFSGLYEQSQLPHLMAYAGCFGPGAHACNHATSTQISLTYVLLITVAINLSKYLI